MKPSKADNIAAAVQARKAWRAQRCGYCEHSRGEHSREVAHCFATVACRCKQFRLEAANEILPPEDDSEVA